MGSPASPASLSTDGARWPPTLLDAPELACDPDAFGIPIELESEDLTLEAESLQVELVGLLEQFVHGPLEAYREQTRQYLAELRKHFLRHHRRLTVLVRSEDKDFGRAVEHEVGELAQRFRDAVLARSSRLQHEPWPFFDVADEVEQVLNTLPDQVQAPIEPRSYSDQPGDGAGARTRRLLLRWGRRWRRMVGAGPRLRAVPMQNLARYHLCHRLAVDLEAMLSILVQGEISLNNRTLSLFDGIVSAFRQVAVDRSEDPDQDDAESLLAQLREEVEEEFVLAETEQQNHAADALRRLQAALVDGISAFRLELPIAGTFELPGSVEAQSRWSKDIQALRSKLEKVQDSLSASYSLTGLRLELVTFRRGVEEGVAETLHELEADVRGRSHTQIERVQQEVARVIEFLEAPSDTQARFDHSVREVLEPLERVVMEAARAERQLEEQLKEDQATQPLIDVIARGVSRLSERYRVPQANLPRAEWKLPSASPPIEIPFSSVVNGFVQSELAPKLLDRTAQAADALSPLAQALADLERLVQYNPEQYSSELELEENNQEGPEGMKQALTAAARTHRDTLATLEAQSATWARDLRTDLMRTVSSQLDELASRFSPEAVSRVKAPRRGPRTEAVARWQPLARFSERVRKLWGRAVTRVRTTVQVTEPVRSLSQGLAAPKVDQVPRAYRRLFGPSAYWAGDVVPASASALEQARDVLAKGPGLRTVAVVGVDGAGRGAVLSAVLQGLAFPSVRRVTLMRPTHTQDLAASLADLGRGNLVVVSGIGYLLAAEPGGFEPIRALVKAMLDDEGRNGWLLDADELTWSYASQAAALSEATMERVDLRRLDRAELERAIFARHQLSGKRVEFVLDDRTEEVAPDGHAEEKRGSPRIVYFQRLQRASDGLLQVALTHWLASVERYGADSIRIGEAPPSPKDALRLLSPEKLNALYLVLRQGWMSPRTLAFILQRTPEDAEARLRQMVHEGLLERSSEGWFTVRRHLRGAAHRVLKEARYL